jgi:hypothetical protein
MAISTRLTRSVGERRHHPAAFARVLRARVAGVVERLLHGQELVVDDLDALGDMVVELGIVYGHQGLGVADLLGPTDAEPSQVGDESLARLVLKEHVIQHGA